MKSIAATVFVLIAAGIPQGTLASNLQNAQQSCAQANAHWVGGKQQCACNPGFVQSNDTCVAPAAAGSDSGAPSNAAASGALGSAAATLVGGAVGGLFVTPTGGTRYVHAAPPPVVKGDEDLAPNPAIESGVGDAQDIISGYHPPELSDDAAVSGASPQPWATEPIPLLTGRIADIEAFLQGPTALQDFTAAAKDLGDRTVAFGRGAAARLNDQPSKPAEKEGANADASPPHHAVGYDGLSEAYREAQGSDGATQKLGFEYLPSQTNFFDLTHPASRTATTENQ